MVERLQTRFTNGVNLVHAIAGRVRLRITDSNLRSSLKVIERQLKQQEEISEVRSNEKTGSLLIVFESNKMSQVQLRDSRERCGISEISGFSSDATTTFSRSQASSQAGKRLKAFIPPIIGLLTVRVLRMHSWGAIATYLIITKIARLSIQ